MGTRADFWIGNGPKAEWLGSIAWDGHEWDEPGSSLNTAKTEVEFRKAVEAILDRDDGTRPARGWPWPWNDSNTTDYAYAFVKDSCVVYSFGRVAQEKEKTWSGPNMKDVQNIRQDEGSGVIFMSTVANAE